VPQRAGNIGKLPKNVQKAAIGVFAGSYRLQFQAMIAFAAAQILASLLIFKRGHQYVASSLCGSLKELDTFRAVCVLHEKLRQRGRILSPSIFSSLLRKVPEFVDFQNGATDGSQSPLQELWVFQNLVILVILMS
jgi:hypothetical protein